MAALTRDELMAKAIDVIAGFPTVAQQVRSGDPRVLAPLGAQAAMMAMLSEQMEVARFEPFVRSRDGTILADASLKGILPTARAAQVVLSIENRDSEAVTLGAQRRLLDSRGRLFELSAEVTIQPGATATAPAEQIRRRSITVSIANAADFHAVQVPLTEDSYLNTLSVFKGAQEFRYAVDWFNVAPDELCYQVETDERRQMFVKFGKASVVGYGVQAGDQLTLDITECTGRISDLQMGGQFTLEYTYNAPETGLVLQLQEVRDEGAAPPSMPELRVMARYPAIYDHNAVYLGEFEFLLRRYLSGIRFLSVWNEQIEEGVRGSSAANINTLFVSGLVSGMSDAVFQERVRTLIKRADDSYRIKFVPAEPLAVPVAITGSIAISWDRARVESQARSLLLSQYGDGSINVSQGMQQPIKRSQINRILREQVAAFRDDKADYGVAVTLPATVKPEHFLHVTAASLSVSLTSVDYGVSLWNQ